MRFIRFLRSFKQCEVHLNLSDSSFFIEWRKLSDVATVLSLGVSGSVFTFLPDTMMGNIIIVRKHLGMWVLSKQVLTRSRVSTPKDGGIRVRNRQVGVITCQVGSCRRRYMKTVARYHKWENLYVKGLLKFCSEYLHVARMTFFSCLIYCIICIICIKRENMGNILDFLWMPLTSAKVTQAHSQNMLERYLL